MTSKEALDKYRKSTFIVGEILVTESKQDISTEEAIKRIRKTFNKYNVGFLTYLVIKQDLEKLEQLEIANKNNEGLVRENVDLINRNLKLQDKNKELKETIDDMQRDYDSLDFEQAELYKEIAKLKQAIDILKENIHVEFAGDGFPYLIFIKDKFGCECTLIELTSKTEYELLKEVLE